MIRLRPVLYHQSSCGVVILHRENKCETSDRNRLDQSLKETVIYGSALRFT